MLGANSLLEGANVFNIPGHHHVHHSDIVMATPTTVMSSNHTHLYCGAEGSGA